MGYLEILEYGIARNFGIWDIQELIDIQKLWDMG